MLTARAIVEFLDVPTAGTWAMTPEEALAFLRTKGLRTTFDYRAMMGAEHARAFTVAKMMDQDLLADVHASLADALERGVPFKEWADTITPTLQAKGWWGRKAVTDPLTGETIVAQLGSPSRLQTIYRTNMQSAYAAGQWDSIVQQSELAPYLLYDAVDDHRTRPEHAAWDGVVLPVSHPWWESHYPPNGWNCRCSVIQLSEDDLADLGLAVDQDAPAGETYTWQNPNTGRFEKIPKGLDPGWAVNMGEARTQALAKAAATKLAGYAAELQAAAAQGMLAAAQAAKDSLAADVAAGQKAWAKEMGADNLAAMTMKAHERSAAAQLATALDKKTPYLAKSINDLKKTKAGQAMSQTELWEAANIQAAKLKQQTALSDWKKAYMGDKPAPGPAQAAYDALPHDAKAALVKQLDQAKLAKKAEAAAGAKLDEIVLGSSNTMEAKALDKLLASGATDTMTKVQMLAKVEADVAAAKAVQVHAQVTAGLKKALAADKLPTAAQQAVLDGMPATEKAAFLAEVDKLKAANLAKAPKPVGMPAAQGETITPAASLNPDKLVQVGPQKGSNPGGLYLDTETGVHWYIKTPATLAHAQNEIVAGHLYRAAGIDVPELRLTMRDGKPSVASRIVDGLSKGTPETLAAAAGAADGFVVDAWLANWDVVGLGFDNLLMRGSQAFRVDTGGALLFRAQGTAKGAAFGDLVTELKTFLDPTKNANTAQVFGKLTSEQLAASARRVLAISDDQIRALVTAHGPTGALGETLAKRLIARKADLAKQFATATEVFTKAKAAAIDAAEFAAKDGLAAIDGAMLTAIKGIAKRKSDGVPLEMKDLQRVADARAALAAWVKEHRPVLVADSLAEVESYYQAWLGSLQDAVSPGAGKMGLWAGETFAGYSAALKVDAGKVTVTLPPEGLTFTQAAATQAITDSLGSYAAKMDVPQRADGEALRKVLPLEHQRAITAYTGSYYSQVNDALREGTASLGTLRYADLVNEALSLAPNYVGQVTRGIRLYDDKLATFLADHRQALITGQGVTHAGFISTSKGATAAMSGNVILHIQSRTGTWVKPLSLVPKENEVLLKHGTRFNVTDMKQQGDTYHIYLDEVGTNG